ncbi:MAG TPA: hypothetical protein DCY03_23970 [Planctomycetaceae bacterium]|nr:hypothetical protein [Planctomycetaceae bacterium]
MSVSSTGLLSWQVPADFPKSRVSLILSITDTSGQQLFQTDRLKVKGTSRQTETAPQPDSSPAKNVSTQNAEPVIATKPDREEPLTARKP